MAITALSAATTACEAAGWQLTQLELQKLLYLSQRTFLGRNHGREPLLRETFEAWNYGPVIPSLYRLVRIFGPDRIDSLPPVTRNLRLNEHAVIREVVDYFNGLTPGELVDLTHMTGGAWDRNFVPGRRHCQIPNEHILEEYEMVVHNAAAR